MYCVVNLFKTNIRKFDANKMLQRMLRLCKSIAKINFLL